MKKRQETLFIAKRNFETLIELKEVISYQITLLKFSALLNPDFLKIKLRISCYIEISFWGGNWSLYMVTPGNFSINGETE